MAASFDSMSLGVGGMRKRVGRACDRCRLKKSKCDGSSPCTRCKDDNKICVFGQRKRSHDKVHPKGYVEALEAQQAQLVAGLQELYRRLQTDQGWLGSPLEEYNAGCPLTHDILLRLDIIKKHDKLESYAPRDISTASSPQSRHSDTATTTEASTPQATTGAQQSTLSAMCESMALDLLDLAAPDSPPSQLSQPSQQSHPSQQFSPTAQQYQPPLSSPSHNTQEPPPLPYEPSQLPSSSTTLNLPHANLNLNLNWTSSPFMPDYEQPLALDWSEYCNNPSIPNNDIFLYNLTAPTMAYATTTLTTPNEFSSYAKGWLPAEYLSVSGDGDWGCVV